MGENDRIYVVFFTKPRSGDLEELESNAKLKRC
jgi:hypothetical protein